MSKTNNANNGVYFLSLELENVRCFGKEQKLDLSDGKGNPARWTVILGNNGTGKTTLLQTLIESNVLRNRMYNLPKNGTNYYKIKYNYALNNLLENKQSNFFPYSVKIDFTDGDLSTTVLHDDTSKERYYSVQKYNIYAYNATRKLSKNKLIPFNNQESNEDYDELINAEEWLLQTDYIANKESEIQTNYQLRFKIIKDILINLLPDVTNIRVSKPSKTSPNPRVEFKTPNGWLLLFQLSLGYQTMIAWMVDLAGQLFSRYPDSPNPIAEPAVVLIDEIDLHLHPKWQREIMRYLSERFINTQFIVTAHSPLIVQAAEDQNANIVVLRREGDEVIIDQNHEEIHGWRVDQLLASDLFGLEGSRSKKYEDLLTKRRAILGKSKLTAHDKKELKRLELEMGDIPTAETPEDIKAMDIIRRAAKLLEAEHD